MTPEQETEIDKEFIDEFQKLCTKYNRQLYPAIKAEIQLQRIIKNEDSQRTVDGAEKSDTSQASK